MNLIIFVAMPLFQLINSSPSHELILQTFLVDVKCFATHFRTYDEANDAFSLSAECRACRRYFLPWRGEEAKVVCQITAFFLPSDRSTSQSYES